MPEPLILNEDKKKKKGSLPEGLRLVPDPRGPYKPRKLEEAEPIGPMPRYRPAPTLTGGRNRTLPAGLRLVLDPDKTVLREDQPAEEQKLTLVEEGYKSIASSFKTGDYSIPDDQLDAVLGKESLESWHNDFGSKVSEVSSHAAKMLLEDFVVGISWSGPKQSMISGMSEIEQNWFTKNLQAKHVGSKFMNLFSESTDVDPDIVKDPFGQPGMPRRGSGGITGMPGGAEHPMAEMERVRLRETIGASGTRKAKLKDIYARNTLAIRKLTNDALTPEGGGIATVLSSPEEVKKLAQSFTGKRREQFEATVKAINRKGLEEARNALGPEGRKKFDKLKLKGVRQLFEGEWKPGIVDMVWSAVKLAHPLGTPLKSQATNLEAVARGVSDIGMIGNMIAANAFDRTTPLQKKYNIHMNGKIREYWKGKGVEYERGQTIASTRPEYKDVPLEEIEKWREEIPNLWFDLREARRDKFQFMHILMVDRERARTGVETTIGKWMRNYGASEDMVGKYEKHVNTKDAEARSYIFDPITIGTAGAAAVLKTAPVAAAKASLTRTVAGKTLQYTGQKATQLGEKLSGVVEEVVKETGTAGEIAAAKPGLVARGLKTIGPQVQATGEAIIKEGGFFENLSKSATLPGTKSRTTAAWLSAAGTDRALNLGADVVRSGTTGAGIGIGLGVLAGDEELAIAGATIGPMLGVPMVIPARLMRPYHKFRQQEMVSEFVGRQDEATRAFIETRPFKEQVTMAEMDALVKGVASFEGQGDVPVKFVYEPDRAVEGAWIGTKGEIEINMARSDVRTMPHEVMHALDALAAADPTSASAARLQKLNDFLFDRRVGDTTIEGHYSIKDELEFAKQYHARLKRSFEETHGERDAPDALRDWEVEHGFESQVKEMTIEQYMDPKNTKARNLIQSEIRAESLANLIQGSKPGTLGGAKSVKQKLLDHILLSDHSQKLVRMRWLLEKFGVEFNKDGAVSELFIKDGKGITNSPMVNARIREFVRARNSVRERVVPETDAGTNQQSFTMKEVAENPELVKYFGASDAFVKDRNGNVIVVDGKPVILPIRDINKLQRKRVGQIMEALDSVDSIGGLEKSETAKGKPRWSGKNLNQEQLQAILDLPDDVLSPRLKENIQFLFDKVNEGASIHFDYNAALKGRNYSSAIQAAWRHDMPYAMEITQAGNFNIKTLNVDRIQSKIGKWRRDKKGRFLDLWDGEHGEFLGSLHQYMDNHQKGLPGHTNLHPDEGIAAAMKTRINELFDVPGSKEFRPESLGIGKAGGRPPLSARRFDRINQMKTGGGEWSANYGMLRHNLLPAGETPPTPRSGEQLLPAKPGAKPEAGGPTGQLVPKSERVTLKRPARIKPLEEKAQHIDEMTKEQWDATVEELAPIRPIADKDLPTIPKLNVMDDALLLRNDNGDPLILNKKQIESVGKPQHGMVVWDARIDIESVRRGKDEGIDIHAIAVKGDDGKTTYTGHLVLDPIIKGGQVELHYGTGKTAELMLKTAQGKAKTTFAFVDGKVNARQIPTKAELMRPNAAGERVWTQVGYNPTKHGYFFNRNDPSMKVLSGDRVLMAGNTVYVRNAKVELGRQVKAVKVPGLTKMGRGEGAGAEVRYMPSKVKARDIELVAKEVGGGEFSPEVKRFGAFMRKMQDKGIEPRDVVKSYLITLSSIQRGAQNVTTLQRRWIDAPFAGEKVRPEDAFAKLLGTEEGQRYLNDAERGVFNEPAADAMIEKFRGFGLHNKLKESMRVAAEEFAPKANEIIDAVNKMPADEFAQYVRENFKGINYGKVGFMSGQLGRGDIPTVDSRAKKLHYGKADLGVTKDRLAEVGDRLLQLGIEVPKKMEEFAGTLLHHEVWDRLAGTRTEHGEIKTAMVQYMPAGKNAEVAPGIVRAKPNSEVKLSESVLAQYMPARPKVNLQDYADRTIVTLPADRMGIGEMMVGPEGAKRPLSIEAQGGRGFMNIFNGGGWAFSDAAMGKKFLNHLAKFADADGNVLVGITIQSPVNHLKNQTGQLAYVETMIAAVDSKAISKRAADSQVRVMSESILSSKAAKMTDSVRAKMKKIKTLKGLERAVRAKSLNFEDMAWVLKQWEREKLHIPGKDLRAMDIAPEQIARDAADPELAGLPNYSVVALLEVNVNQVPKETGFHYAYPATVEGNTIGFLNKFHNIKDLTTDPRIIQKATGQVGAQPLQTVMPVMDNILKTIREKEGIPSELSARGDVSYMPAMRKVMTDATPDKIVNPIDATLPGPAKVKILEQLTIENEPKIKEIILDIDSNLGTTSKYSVKKPENILSKSQRPEIKAKKPWFDVEHVRDSMRFKTKLNGFSDLSRIVRKFEEHGVEIIELDFSKMMTPKEWGWRMVTADLRFPNGQIVEWYAPFKELDAHAVKEPNHILFEKWRNTTLEYRKSNKEQFARDMKESNDRYGQAWDAALSRLGIDEKAAAASMSKEFESSSSKTGSKKSLSSSAEGTSSSLPKDQTPSRRRPKTGKAQAITSLESGSIENLRSETSIRGVSPRGRQKSTSKTRRIEQDLKKLKRK